MEQEPGEDRHDAAAATADAIALSAPFAAVRGSFLHAALDVPRMQAAAPFPAGEGLLRLSSDHVKTVEAATIDGHRNRMDGIFHEFAALDGAWGVVPGLELGARISVASWDEEQDVFSILDETGQPIVFHEWVKYYDEGSSRRHMNVSALELRSKVRLLEGDSPLDALSVLSSASIPIARPMDLTNAGTYDLGVTLLATKALGDFVLHANAGVTFPVGHVTLFEDDSGVDVVPFLHGGLAATWQFARAWSAGLQIEGNTSAFEGHDFLDGPPLTIFGGVRRQLGRALLEAGVGTGLLEDSSYDLAWRVALAWRF